MTDYTPHNRISTEELLKELRRVSTVVGDVPTTHDMREEGEYSSTPYSTRFGSWTNALREAGISPTDDQQNRSSRLSKFDKESVIKELQRLFDEHGKVTKDVVDDYGELSSTTVQKYFDDFNTALRSADVPVTDRQDLSETFECRACGSKVTRAPWEFEQHEHQFCSQDCLHKPAFDDTCSQCGDGLTVSLKQLHAGENTFCGEQCHTRYFQANPSNPTTLACSTCGDDVVRNSAAASEIADTYCSPECRAEGSRVSRESLISDLKETTEQLGETPTLSDITTHAKHAIDTYYRRFESYQEAVREAGLSPNQQSVEIQCANCGQARTRAASLADNRNFCDQECYFEWTRDGGLADDNNRKPEYGSNWPHQRKKARERDDFTCQSCGMGKKEHLDIYGQVPHVHHITPWHEFEDQERRNDLNNLIVFCASCHVKWENLPVEPQIN